VSAIPGPGEVTSGVLSAAVGAALTKPGRRVMFWGVAVPMVLGIVVYTLGWWLVPIALGLLAFAAGVLLAVRRLHRHALVVAPASLRAALPAPRRAVALPRGLSVTRGRRALPAPAKALPAAELTGRVVPAPARGKVVR
jgi:hypothetical protein